MTIAFFHPADGYIAASDIHPADNPRYVKGDIINVRHTNHNGILDNFIYEIIDIRHDIEPDDCIPHRIVYIVQLCQRKKK